jgi:hypothetical protein
MVASFRAVIFGMLCLTIALVPASEASSPKLELQQIADKEIPFSGCSCSANDRKSRMIFIAESGTPNAWIKLSGKVIKLKLNKEAGLNGDPNRSERFTAKDLELSIVYGGSKRVGYELAKYSNVKFNVTYKGRKVNIPVTGYCGC